MSTFDTFADSPFQIKREGQEIVVTQTRLSPTSIRVSWTLPHAIACGMPGAYNGAIVTLDQFPTANSKLPSDGSVYKADSTASVQLHAGSRIGAALVVGAFYNDKTTTSVDITDAPADQSFYVSLHAVDNVHRYHTDGVQTYALPYDRDVELPTAGYDIVTMGVGGVFPTTPTGLDVAKTYSFKLMVDQMPDISVVVPGATAQTYQALIDTINMALILKDNPLQSAIPPLFGTYVYSIAKQILKQFDGEKYNIVPNVIINNKDPLLSIFGDIWLDTFDLVNPLKVFTVNGWEAQPFITLARDPRNPYCNDYWYNGSTIHKWNGGTWILQTMINSVIDPALAPVITCHQYWFHDDKLYQYDEARCQWAVVPFVSVYPTFPTSGQLYVDLTNHIVQIWSDVDGVWVTVQASFSLIDPALPVTVAQGTIWHETISDKFFSRDGTSWKEVIPTRTSTAPQALTQGTIWYNSATKVWNRLMGGSWVPFLPMLFNTSATDTNEPNIPTTGRYWYNNVTQRLYQFDGSSWVAITFSLTEVFPATGSVWFNTATNTVMVWSGVKYNILSPVATLTLNAKGNLVFTSATTGSKSWVCIPDLGTLFAYTTLTPYVHIEAPVKGTDPVSKVPSYLQPGVGTDGSQDERRNMIERVKNMLGYPTMEVELSKQQMDLALDMAFEKLRSSSSAPYKRGYFALDLMPRQQHYKLTDQTVGFNKIVDVLYLYRQSATFIGTAAGNDVFGQMMVQNLYSSGKFDLLSYHMVSSYMETMKQLFASEIQFNWDEYSRTLSIYKDFPRAERVLVDAMVERTEQELLVDRWTRSWIQRYTAAQARYMLAEIRGKFSTLPGAGGNVSLNASDLRAKADADVLECMEEIDNYVVNNLTDFGMGSSFVFG